MVRKSTNKRNTNKRNTNKRNTKRNTKYLCKFDKFL